MYDREIMDTISVLASVVQGLGIMVYIILIVSLLVPYVITGYMIMCVGKKARLNSDWMPFVPIARQLYQMKIADCPWWYIFFFGGTLVTSACIGIVSALLGALFKNPVLIFILILIYGVANLVFTFLYYRRYYERFGFNPNTAWVEIIWSFGIISQVLLVFVAFSDAIRYRSAGEVEAAPVPRVGPAHGAAGGSVIEAAPPQRRPAAPAGKAVIAGVAGKYAGASFDLASGAEVVFGRSAVDANIVFDQFETDISRKHCSVRYDGIKNQFVVTDHSTNGTFTDTRQLRHDQPEPLPCGTVIYLGKNRKNSFRLG